MQPEIRVFTGLEAMPTDPLLAVISACAADPRPGKIDLGVGVFRDAQGRTPVMENVKQAEQVLLETQPTKTYLGGEGDVRFTALLRALIFGAHDPGDRLTGLQTPGGTGALHLGFALLSHLPRTPRVLMGLPSWPNHRPIIDIAGLPVVTCSVFSPDTQRNDVAALLAAMEELRPGDVVLLQAGCHNPTGCDFSQAEWDMILDRLLERDLLPFLDCAYHGLGIDLENDVYAVRRIAEKFPEALIAYSCDKNFGLYRERTGALYALLGNREEAATILSNLLAIARAIWSMPPDHGAAAVRTILEDQAITRLWETEVTAITARIRWLRETLASASPGLSPLARQHGMFSLLPLDPSQIAQLRERHGIYMVGSGRINVCGLTDANIPGFVEALADVGFAAEVNA